jgi:hypothetical protein
MCWADQHHIHHGCYARPFSNTLCHFVTCSTLVTSSSHTFINRQWNSRRKTRLTQKNRITIRTSSRGQKFPVLPTHPTNSIWLLRHLLNNVPNASAAIYQNMKRFNNTKVSKNSTNWYAPYKQTHARETFVDVWCIPSFFFIVPKSVRQFISETSARWAQKRGSILMQGASHSCWLSRRRRSQNVERIIRNGKEC